MSALGCPLQGSGVIGERVSLGFPIRLLYSQVQLLTLMIKLDLGELADDGSSCV